MTRRPRQTLAIYSDTAGGLGGNEYCVGVAAAAASRAFDVDLYHHWSGVTNETWSALVGEDMSQVSLRHVARDTVPPHPFYGRDSLMRQWVGPLRSGRALSAGYDRFLQMGHLPPPVSHARRAAYYTQFPLFDFAHSWPFGREGGTTVADRMRRRLARMYWRRRFAGYARGFGNSAFTASWLRRRWEQEASVLYPPVSLPDHLSASPRRPTICIIGRFGRSIVDKHILEMVEAFVASDLPSRGMRMIVFGGLADSAADRQYLADVRARSEGFPVELRPNAATSDIRCTLAEAALFWHAAGLAVDPQLEPQGVEHFGIAVVEAMANGCVPVVIGVGGPAETVRHDVDGLQCRSLADMVDATRRVTSDSAMWARMSSSAARRARGFSHGRFAEGLLEALQ